jgi:hypothetical protein
MHKHIILFALITAVFGTSCKKNESLVSEFGYIEDEMIRLNYCISDTAPPSSKRVLIIQGKTDGINFGSDKIEFKRVNGEEFSISLPRSRNQSWIVWMNNQIDVINADTNETISALKEWKHPDSIPESLLSILKTNKTRSEPIERGQ